MPADALDRAAARFLSDFAVWLDARAAVEPYDEDGTHRWESTPEEDDADAAYGSALESFRHALAVALDARALSQSQGKSTPET